jgi:hypothetical protein
LFDDEMAEQSTTTKLSSGVSLAVLIPVFEDWKAADHLLQELDRVFGQSQTSAEIVLVDDGSLQGVPEWFPSAPFVNLKRVRVLELKRNVGHQRAICVGLVLLEREKSPNPVLIMDADGEDAPTDVPRLLEEFANSGRQKVIFAERGRRAEGLVFKTFYQIYRSVHRALVGFDIRVGNFSVVPQTRLNTLVVSSELWNHYAATVIKARLPVGRVRVDRSRRVAGQSSMGFVGLVVHGLSAMAVYGDTVGTRLLMLFSWIGALAVLLLCMIAGLRVATNLVIPEWAMYTAGVLLLLLFQSLTLVLFFTFVVLGNRSQSNFIPVRDCPYYLRRWRTIFERRA